MHRHADLKIARGIPRAGQRRDLPLGQLGREALLPRIGKTHRGHRAGVAIKNSDNVDNFC